MLFNIPITVPIIEFLIIYSTLRVLKSVNIPSWTKPFITGLSAMVFDFSLDPVAVKQIFETMDGTIARWTYYPLAGEPQIYGEPVMNFTGWIYIAGYWTVFILIGNGGIKRKATVKPLVTSIRFWRPLRHWLVCSHRYLTSLIIWGRSSKEPLICNG